MSELAVSTKQNGTHLIVSLMGEMDMTGAKVARDQVLQMINEGSCDIVLDFTNVSLLSSMGLSAVVGLHKDLAGKEGGKLSVICPAGYIQDVFTATGTDQIIPLYENESELGG